MIKREEFFEEELNQDQEPVHSRQGAKARKSEPLRGPKLESAQSRKSEPIRAPKMELQEATPIIARRPVKRSRVSEQVVENAVSSSPSIVGDDIPNKRRKTNRCLDCQGPIYPESDRCK